MTRYPKSAKYDQSWVEANWMGPNPLWLLEELCAHLDLRPGIFAKLVKPNGQFGIVVPGLTREFEKGCPDTLESLWVPELFTFHSKEWWRRLWEKTGLCSITVCCEIENPKSAWYPWAKWAKENMGFDDEEFLDADTNNDIALIVMAARKSIRQRTT